MTTTPGRIYLADQRGLVASPQQQRHCTFDFEEYAAEGRAAFGGLRAFNEESLAAGGAVAFAVPQATHLLLLPVTGAVEFASTAPAAGTVDVEEVRVLTLPAGSQVELRNPYPDAVITFLHVWLDAAPDSSAGVQDFAYQFGALDNQLAELVPLAGLPFSLSLGRFQGRHEAVYRVREAGHRLFVFVLAGAFELEGRLLHAQDGLALWHCPAAELEALSNDALVLLLELAA